MKLLFSFVLFCAFALLTIPVGNTAPEAEWPQWRGPLRSDYSASWKQAASLGTLAATGHVSPNRLSPSRRISKADA
jgi:hypothetical protein